MEASPRYNVEKLPVREILESRGWPERPHHSPSAVEMIKIALGEVSRGNLNEAQCGVDFLTNRGLAGENCVVVLGEVAR